MKKLVLGTVVGIALGAAVTWLALRHQEEPDAHAAPAKKEAEAKHDGALHWTKEQQTAAGVVTAQPKSVEVRPELKAFGRVLDASTIAVSLGDIEGARSLVEEVAAESSGEVNVEAKQLLGQLR